MMNAPQSCILVVDDDTALLQALSQALSLRLPDIQVKTTDSTVEALELVQHYDYDAIVSDIKMPVMDGLVLLTRIKELRPETPALLITGHGERDLAIQALRVGAYDFIQKPIDRDYIVATLQRAIQTYRLRRQVREQQLALEHYAQSLEALVQERTRELVEANAAKDVFLGLASHELKTPLTSLKGMIQLLKRRRERAEETLQVQIATMERSVNRIEILVNDLLSTSLLETGMFALHPRRCNLTALCQHILNEYIAGTNMIVTMNAPPEPLAVEVDLERIGQVLLNLLSNASKYSPPGAPIALTLVSTGDKCIVAVQDQGLGIPAEQLPHIFERFYRVPGIERQKGSSDGLGLGLYIARKIVERHEGHIEVQSKLGSGSTFSVSLPLAVNIYTSSQAQEETASVPSPNG
jgi:two-component system, sensor histidine kinase and response regulator